MAKKDELTPRQMQFAMLYAVGDRTATECAKLSGYQSAGQQANRLLKDERIGVLVAEQKKFHLERISWDANKVVTKMASLHDRAVEDGAWTPAINALSKIANWLGMDNHNSTKHVTVDVAFEDLLQRTIDITPAQSADVLLSSDKNTSAETEPKNLS
jgi:hypothetical protein